MHVTEPAWRRIFPPEQNDLNISVQGPGVLKSKEGSARVSVVTVLCTHDYGQCVEPFRPT